MGVKFAARITEAKYGDIVAIDPESPFDPGKEHRWMFVTWAGEGDAMDVMILGGPWSGDITTFSSSGLVVVEEQ